MDSRLEDEEAGRDGNMKAVPVGLVSTSVVSSLPQPVRDSVPLTGRTLAERFHTPIGHRDEKDVRNTIRACIHGNQTVISGQGVRMRLQEPMRVGKHVLPKNSLLIGEGRIQGERLHVNILQVEYGGTIIPVKLAVYDNDGQEGIFIPYRCTVGFSLGRGRISARAYPSPTSRQATSCFPNSGRVPYRVSRSTSPGRCVKRRCISNPVTP